jgi:hypothetical protein
LTGGGLRLTQYMFDPALPLWLRGLSLFHVWMPPLLGWMVWRWGYDRRALIYATLMAWIVLPVTYLVVTPGHRSQTINWVLGPAGPPPPIPQPWYLLAWMLVLPVAIYLPTHVLLIWIDRKRARRYESISG